MEMVELHVRSTFDKSHDVNNIVHRSADQACVLCKVRPQHYSSNYCGLLAQVPKQTMFMM